MALDGLYNILAGRNNELENDPFESVSRMRTRYEASGETAPAPKVTHSFLNTALKVIDYPDNIARGAVLEGFEGAKKAAMGEKTYSVRQALDQRGVPDGFNKTAMSFIGDVLLSPTTYLGSGLVKNAGMKALESGAVKGMASKNLVEQTFREVGKETTTRMGATGANDLAQVLTQHTGVNFTGKTIDDAKALTQGDLSQVGMKGVQERAKAHLVTRQGELDTANRSMTSTGVSFTGAGVDSATRKDVLTQLLTGGLTKPNDFLSTPGLKAKDAVNHVEAGLGRFFEKEERRTLSAVYKSNPDQFKAMTNIVDMYGAKIKNVDSLIHMSGKAVDSDYVAKVAERNQKLLDATAEFDKANVYATYTNNLVMEFDKLGNKRFWGVMLPNGKTIMPLADISPVTKAIDDKFKTLYEKNGVYRGLSDWWRTAISGTPTRRLETEGLQDAANELIQTVRQPGNVERNKLRNLHNFEADAFGQEVLNMDSRIKTAATLYREAQVDDAGKYLWSEITQNGGGLSMEDKAAIIERLVAGESAIGHEGLQRINALLVSKIGQKLTDEEAQMAIRLADKAQAITDTIFSVEKVKGLEKALDENYNTNYVKHMYKRNDAGLMALHQGGVGAAKIAAQAARKFATVATAVARDVNIMDVDLDIIGLTTSRLQDTIMLGMKKGLIEGIANVLPATSLDSVLRGKIDDFVGAGHVDDGLIDRVAAAKATTDTIKNTLKDVQGLKELTQVIKHKDDVPDMLKGTEWKAITEIFDMTNHGKPLYYVHKDLYPYIEELNKNVFHIESLNKFLEVTDNATRILKRFQTTLNPAFIPRNFIGESFMSFFGNGTSTEAFADAGNVLHGLYKSVEVDGKQMFFREALNRLEVMPPDTYVKLGGSDLRAIEAIDELKKGNVVDLGTYGKKTYQEIYNEAMNFGLMTSGFASDVNKNLKGGRFVEQAKTKLSEGILGVPKTVGLTLETAADTTEAMFRLSDYIHNLRAGLTPEEAALRVKMFHVDYQDLTKMEKNIMRRIIPYYTFMRKNIPIQLRMLVERPGLYGGIGKLVNNSYEAFGNPATPEYLHEQLALPIYEDEDGNVTYLNWNLPLTDLARLTDSRQKTFQETTQMLHPAFKALFDLAADRNLAFDTPMDVPDYLMGQMGGLSTVYKTAQEAMTPDDAFTGQYAKPEQNGLMRSLLPVVNPQKEELARAYRYRDELQQDVSTRKKEGAPIPELEDPRSVYNRLGVRVPTDSANAYEKRAEYWQNKDWVQNNSVRFTP